MFSLRNRLLASYLLLLMITLGTILATFAVATGSQPAPPQPTYQRLAAVLQGMNIADLLTETITGRGVERPTVRSLLDNFAETRDIRVMVFNINQQQVVYDSSGRMGTGDSIHLSMDGYRMSGRHGMTVIAGGDLIFGNIMDGDEEWLFSGVTAVGRGAQVSALVVTDRRPIQSLQSVLADFAAALAPPLLQAAGVGLIIAIILAALISRTIARPLQAASAAATAVARGDLNQSVPVSGPPEVRAVGEAFNRMSAEVRATQQAQRDFIANISHDLKTPLTSIQGYSQAIIDGTIRDPQQAADIIYDEAARLNRMVIDLTDLTRMQAGQFTLHKVPVQLDQLVRSVAQNLAVIAKQEGIVLLIDAQPVPVIEADGDRLVQVLNNLISNAIKFTPPEGQIRVSTRPYQNGIEIAVKDTGAGIPEDELPRIFERFYQVDKARGPSRGAGLGLAIVREIVQAHGGKISVSSQEDSGTIFNVWFPAVSSPVKNGVHPNQ